MNAGASPREVVERQLHAYNARDIEAYCALFAHDAVILKLNANERIACGASEIRAYYTARFRNEKLHCTVQSRIELGDFVVDHEVVAGIRDEALQVIAIYEVREGLIKRLNIIWP